MAIKRYAFALALIFQIRIQGERSGPPITGQWSYTLEAGCLNEL